MSKMPRVIPNNVPAGGFHFPEAGELLTGSSVDDLARQVASKRRLRSALPGDPRAEVEDYICRHNPGDCFGNRVGQIGSPRDGYEREVVTQWAASFTGLPALVDAPTAQARAETGCIGCPHNKPYGCCQNKQPRGPLGDRLSALRQGRDVTRYASELYSCSQLSHDNHLAVWLSAEEVLNHLPMKFEAFPSLPARCWVPGALVAISADDIPNPLTPNYP